MSTQKTSLTNRLVASKIKEAVAKGQSLTLWDGEVRGFGARISPTGRVTWVARKAIGRGRGSTQSLTLGHYPGMSLEAARIDAGLAIARLAKGEDVVSQVKQARRDKVERQQCPSVKAAVSDYLDARKHDPKRDMSSRYEVELRQLFERQIVPELGVSKRVNEITKADVKGILKTRQEAGHYVAARNLYVLLRPFFDWCKSEEHITLSPMQDIEAPAPAQKRQHKLIAVEIRTLWLASFAFKQFGMGAYWRLLLMLLQRRGELASMQWQEVNLSTAEWIIPGSKTKNGKDHLVPLPYQALKELASIPTRKPNEYVFGKFPDAPFSGFSKAKRELEAVMMGMSEDPGLVLNPWRIHDLRRTGATLMSGVKVHGSKVQPHIIEAILNHTPPQLEATYQVWDVQRYADEKKGALQAWADRLDVLTADQTNVVQMKA